MGKTNFKHKGRLIRKGVEGNRDTKGEAVDERGCEEDKVKVVRPVWVCLKNYNLLAIRRL